MAFQLKHDKDKNLYIVDESAGAVLMGRGYDPEARSTDSLRFAQPADIKELSA